MKMFAGEWTIKVLGWLGMEEGMAIEDKRITKGIIKAQKKVEERNFLQRKNLLDYDEVMDHQRTTFYGMRQQVLEGREVDSGDLGDDRRRDPATRSRSTSPRIMSPPTSASGPGRISRSTSTSRICAAATTSMSWSMYIKDQARAEAETNITATIGEFMGEDDANPGEWDTKGLSRLGDEPIPGEPAAEPDSQDGAPTSWRTGCAQAAIEQIDNRDASGC